MEGSEGELMHRLQMRKNVWKPVWCCCDTCASNSSNIILMTCFFRTLHYSICQGWIWTKGFHGHVSLVYTWFWMNHLDKQGWMSPHYPWAARNSDTVTPLIRADSNVGAALIHSAFRDIASLTRWEPDKMESQIFDIWPWHCLLQKPDHTSVLAPECCTLNTQTPCIGLKNSNSETVRSDYTNLQSSYANNCGHQIKEHGEI